MSLAIAGLPGTAGGGLRPGCRDIHLWRLTFDSSMRAAEPPQLGTDVLDNGKELRFPKIVFT
ncbi:hypothetical protein AB4Z01_14470 [Inquilinus sp. YAF38]|uniref:hypothetical protein n=1 Tax=Inquilinus sp. YAF38 TaxID=3233084 RepID=UPI003F908121